MKDFKGKGNCEGGGDCKGGGELEDEGEEESVVQSQLDLRNPRKRIKPGDF